MLKKLKKMLFLWRLLHWRLQKMMVPRLHSRRGQEWQKRAKMVKKWVVSGTLLTFRYCRGKEKSVPLPPQK